MSKHSCIRTAWKTISRRVTWMKVEMSCLTGENNVKTCDLDEGREVKFIRGKQYHDV